MKLDFACTGGKTLTQVLSQAPANESVAIQITDMTNSKSYSFQAIHAIPYANVASIAAQLEQNGAGHGEFLKWDDTAKQWKPGTVSGASGGTVTSVSVSGPLSVTTPTSTPAISISQADGSTSGYLSSADWNTFNGKQGSIAAGTTAQYYRGDKSWQTLDSSVVPENINLYFTNARVLGVPLTGFVTAAGAIVATDSTLAAFGKAQGQIHAINSAAANYLIKNSTDTVTGVVNVGTTGLLQLTYVPVGMNDATNKSYVDSEVGNKVSKSGDTVTGILTLNSDLKIKGGSNFVTVKGHASSANYNLVLPQTAGTAGYVLSTDGSGNTSWVTSAVGSASITDNSIVDADVNASAAIAQSKIANLTTDLAGKVSTTLSSGNVFVGNGINVATGVAVSGDATLSNSGVLTLANTAVTAGTYKSVTVDGKGRVTGGTNPTTLAGYGITDTLVTGVSVTAPITNTGSATVPLIGMPAATTSVNGYLTSTDWNIFNNKQAAINSASTITTGSVTTSLQGGVNLNPFGVAAGNTGEIRFYELAAGGTNYTSLKAPDTLGANINYTLPSTAPTAGQVLSSSAAGVMSWTTIPSAPVTTVFGRSGAVTATAGDYTAAQVTYSPAGNIAATTVQAALDEIDSEKQGLITTGTTAQYYRGDKTFVDLGTDVRATALTGYAVGANTALAATDSTLAAFQKVQGQINATNTAVAGKEPAITAGTTAQYIRGDKTLSTFATDAINSVLSTFALNGTSKPAVANTDSIVGAFGKVQKFINDINSDYVSKSANQTINGSLAINSVTGFITVPTPVNPNDAANKSYVDGFGQWTKTGSDIYFNTGKVGINTTTPGANLDVNGSSILRTDSNGYSFFVPKFGTNAFTNYDRFEIRVDPLNPVTYIGNVQGGTGATRSLAFTAGGPERMRITDDGKVGIGTGTPVYKLHVAGTPYENNFFATSSIQVAETTGTNRAHAFLSTNDARAIVGGNIRVNPNIVAGSHIGYEKGTNERGAAGLIFETQSAGTGYFRFINATDTNDDTYTVAEPMTISATGNVGIGATSPSYKLSVQGTSVSGSTAQTNISAFTGNGMNILGSISNSSQDAITYSSGGGGGAAIAFRRGGSYDTYLDFYTNNASTAGAMTKAMTIDQFGNVGMGVSSPIAALEVSGAISTKGGEIIMQRPTSGGGWARGLHYTPDGSINSTTQGLAGIGLYGTGTTQNSIYLTFGTAPWNSTTGINILSNGNVGIGTVGPSYKLDVQGGGVNATGGFTSVSDIRLKTNIEYLNSKEALKKITSLNGIYYDWKDQEKLGYDHQIGLIAQQVQKEFPEAIKVNKDGFLSVAYSNLISPVIESIKELSRRILGVESNQVIQNRQIASIKAENDKLKSENEIKTKEIQNIKRENAAIKEYLCSKDPKAPICR